MIEPELGGAGPGIMADKDNLPSRCRRPSDLDKAKDKDPI